MQYTYDDFLKAANGAGLLGVFSQEDLNLAQNSPEYGLSMLKLHQDDQAAETAEQHLLAQEAMNQLRQSYSGSVIQGGVPNGTVIGSGTGTEAPTTGQPTSGEGFQWDKEDSYNQLLDRLVNRQPFEYDHESDPRWGAYKKGYTREGERATADALAKTAAATGGVPSSWAVTAATQAGDYYAGQLADMIPELYDDAYNRHLSEIGLDIDALGALRQDKESGWSDYLRKFEIEQQKFNNALALYNQLGYMTPEIEAALGLGGMNGADGVGGTGGTGGSFSGGGVNNGSLTPEQVMLLQTALGVTADGQYGDQSRGAAGGLTAEEAYERYVGPLGGTEPDSGDQSGEETVDDTRPEGVWNRFENGKMIISGTAYTAEEVEKMLASGQVRQEYDPGTGLYRYVLNVNPR